MSRYTKFLEGELNEKIESVTQKHGLNENFKRDVLTAGITRRPIILIGDVGVGKTMFIKHFIYVEARNELANEIVIYLDFGTRPAFFMDLDKYVIDEIIQQLFDKYNIDIYEKKFVRGIYNLEIERFRRGIYSDYIENNIGQYNEKEIAFLEELIKDSEKHLLKSLNHIVKGRNKQIVVFLDNVDQRPFDFQEKVFLISHSLAETWPVVSFVSLRPDTFTKSKATGVLAAYQPRVFTIDPPRVDKVTKKRLDYALNKLKSMGIISDAHSAIRFDLDKLEKYIEMLIRALEKTSDIIEFIDNMSNGNLRKVIEYIGIFVGSAHVDSTKIFDIIDREGSYQLPIHEFLRALIYKDNEYYNPDDSVFINVFDISSNDPKEHFVILIVLSIIYKTGKKNLNEGYVEKSEIYNVLQKLGYKENEIQNALSLCLKESLIASPSYDAPTSSSYMRILPAGAYVLLKLSCMFTYVDAIIVDTPIIRVCL
jgi:GTPase SAR1 family protein